MYGVIRHYHFDAKNTGEIDRLVRDQFLPLLRKTKGFVSYHWIDTGKGEGASLSVFQDKAGADEFGAPGGGLCRQAPGEVGYAKAGGYRRSSCRA